MTSVNNKLSTSPCILPPLCFPIFLSSLSPSLSFPISTPFPCTSPPRSHLSNPPSFPPLSHHPHSSLPPSHLPFPSFSPLPSTTLSLLPFLSVPFAFPSPSPLPFHFPPFLSPSHFFSPPFLSLHPSFSPLPSLDPLLPSIPFFPHSPYLSRGVARIWEGAKNYVFSSETCMSRSYRVRRCVPPRIFLKWCMVRFGVYFDQILSLKFFENGIFYIKK